MIDEFEDYSDLDSFNEGFIPEHAFTPGIETLSDGSYDFTIDKAELRRTEKSDRVCEWTLRIAGGGTIRHTYWLNRQIGVNALGCDLAVLGYDSMRWGDGPGKTPLSKALTAAVKTLAGKRFRAKKTTRAGTGQNQGRSFHELHINAALPPGTNGTPAMPNPPATYAPPAADMPF